MTPATKSTIPVTKPHVDTADVEGVAILWQQPKCFVFFELA